MEDDEDTPRLPADTLALLQQLQSDRDAQTKQFENLKAKSEQAFEDGTQLSMDLFGEDWNASQFWYTDETARILANQLIADAKEDSAVAVVSAPSVYIQLRNILTERNTTTPKIRLRLLEFDRRFQVLGSDFVYYDFNHPLQLAADLKRSFDRIICDPPFLSEDCQTKTALTVRYLAREWSSKELRFISCTGERMETLISKLYGGVGTRTTTFEPQHSKGLSNEFRCYANFECGEWKWR